MTADGGAAIFLAVIDRRCRNRKRTPGAGFLFRDCAEPPAPSSFCYSMARPTLIHRLLPAFVLLGLTAPAGAQPAPAAARVSPGDGTSTAATSPHRERAVSNGVAAALAAAMPKYAPPPPKPPPVPEEDLPDLRDIDKPKNTIVRLPSYIVRESKPPIFRERDINTKQGLANIAMRRYLTETDRALNRFTLPLFHPLSLLGGTSNEDRAMAMYYEDERLKNMTDVADQTNMVMKADPAAGAQLKTDAQKTFMRWSDMGWNGSGNK